MSMTFAYHARTPSGERVSGTMRALDRSAALAMLRERMLIPSKLESISSAFSFLRILHRSKPGERLAFFRAYAALEQAGVDFSTAFELLIAQARTPRFRDALASIRSDVERGGEKLWAAMSHRPDEFTDLEVAMVAAGEEAGNREDVFDRLAGFLERDERGATELHLEPLPRRSIEWRVSVVFLERNSFTHSGRPQARSRAVRLRCAA
jgi:type II secretory pathway component PulF